MHCCYPALHSSTHHSTASCSNPCNPQPCRPRPAQPIEFILSATTGSLLVVAVAVIRIFLGWQYVGNRLLSAAVEYEETGW